MWGQALYEEDGYTDYRIIPTRVGTSQGFRSRHTFHGDHPHACGDKAIPTSRFCQAAGSSPRVWGQGKRALKMRARTGIIPTRVGTSTPTPPRRRPLEDHPHACGDKNSYFPPNFQLAGIIPTRVGTSILYS